MSIQFLKRLKNKLAYNIWSYFWYRSPIYINLNFTKIFYYWWKSRDYFLKPIIVKHSLKRGDSLHSDYFYLDTHIYNKWLHINFHHCEWKTKFGEFRFESVPYIIVVIMDKVWVWGLEAPLYEQCASNHIWRRNNMLYWEGILEYRFIYKDIVKTYNNHIWVRHYHIENLKDGGYKQLEIQDTLFQALTNKGKQKILEYQKNHKNNEEH